MRAGRLEFAETLEGAMISALRIIAPAFEADEGVGDLVVGPAEHLVFREWGAGMDAGVRLDHVGGQVIPELGLGFAQAPKAPLGIDEDIDEGALGGGLGLVICDVLLDEGGKFGWVFAADDLALGVDTGFESVLRRDGFAGSGARSSGPGSVAAVGLDLFLSCHR